MNIKCMFDLENNNTANFIVLFNSYYVNWFAQLPQSIKSTFDRTSPINFIATQSYIICFDDARHDTGKFSETELIQLW